MRHILEYPLDLAGAAAAARELRKHEDLSPDEALAFARSFRWYRGSSISPTQQEEEILALLRRLAQRPPRRVVEIGTDTGGTLFLWSRVAAPDAVLVAVDSQPIGKLGNHSAWAIVRRGFARTGQRIELLIPRDSHDPHTVEEVRQRLGGESADFLFIDGDHTYEGVKRDFELFAPLVQPGGLIALWSEIKPRHETLEFVA